MIAFAAAWLARERIAGNVIDNLLTSYDVEATYDIVSIDPQRQVIANLVVGDPQQPDFTAEEVTINLDYGLRTPTVEGVELVRPRLYGTYIDGELRFGELDSLIFAESEETSGLPEMDLAIIDGRALIESDYGAIAAKIDGSGPLQDGFTGALAATAPGIGNESCTAETATVFGEIESRSGQATFGGPLRVRDLSCEGVEISSADIGADLAIAGNFSAVDGTANLAIANAAFVENSLDGMTGSLGLQWNADGLNVRHDLAAEGFASSYGDVAQLNAQGSLRSDADFARADWDAEITGDGLALAGGAADVLDSAKSASEGTLIESILDKFERNFSRAVAGGGFSADVTVRRTPTGTSVVMPEAQLRSGAGETIVALSRLNWSNGEDRSRLTGNFITGGAGLPMINGRMERAGSGGLALRMTMADYASGPNRIAIPRLQLRQELDGTIDFNGILTASGAVPGGSVGGLRLPVSGTWSDLRGLRVGRRCSSVQFDSLDLYNLSLRGQSLALCPRSGEAMMRYDDALRINALTRDVALGGRLGDSPTRVTAASAGFAYPGGFDLSGVLATIGEEGSAVRLTAQEVTGELGGEIGGTFSGGTAMLDPVPLDLSDLSGEWAYRDDALIIDQGEFRLTERIDGEARFEPLVARDAALVLADGRIAADAGLLHPSTGRLVTNVDIDHDLGTGIGQAVIDVPGIEFDEELSPEDLTYLAKGVIAFADGTVSGEGLISWNGDELTSTGTFGTDDLDLAAAFGPVDGLSGTIEFTDLLGLTTAPNQTLQIGSINPGIEVLAGELRFSVTDGQLIAVDDARWPFMGGTLILRPVTLDYGAPGSQSYVFEMIALEAAAFIAQMELTNLDAEGTFDGTIPITFDEEGNGTITGGLLISRPPGGNVSYVGELTYEDLGAMANYAFQSLRSLDFRQMSIALDGNVAGEIITKFQIDGVSQGEGAVENFVTRRLAKLPIRFNINVRSENFSQLALIARGWSDPTAFAEGFEERLLGQGGLEIIDRTSEPVPAPEPPEPGDAPSTDARRADELPVQPPESEDTP
ncbi:intermembrane phospholipid transport protein YdbH family protein [Erythrobacter rubeus]|uniref:YdbH domain-containing protein n=1 Tax=Erythrobacter rubeus TaxID=2760803 RepID=A0ABR8KTG0_9SPHN|nr:YdbH domain-containing protein [Erythrobacter rubeus]MBD2841542.1 YdbH domain-containing protein [Erythrobacter rubeus]